MRLQALAKISHANYGINNGQNNQQDGDDCEGGQGLSNGKVRVPVAWLIDAYELEDEVG